MILQWLGFIGLILKIILLSTIYTTVVFLTLHIIQLKVKSKWLENRMKRQFKNWLFVHFIVSLTLFIYSLSYWQDTGRGENPSLPIGYGQRIYSPDFEWTEFYPDLNKTEPNKDELIIDSFFVKDKILCAKVSHEYSKNPRFDFIVCNLSDRTNRTFLDEKEYSDYADKNDLPQKDQFQDFRDYYYAYLDKKPTWRKWLLP